MDCTFGDNALCPVRYWGNWMAMLSSFIEWGISFYPGWYFVNLMATHSGVGTIMLPLTRGGIRAIGRQYLRHCSNGDTVIYPWSDLAWWMKMSHWSVTGSPELLVMGVLSFFRMLPGYCKVIPPIMIWCIPYHRHQRCHPPIARVPSRVWNATTFPQPRSGLSSN